ncbi:MAG: MvdC/MvdD family ATP grasp protein [Bryobacteraceae bacterium]
MILIVTHSKDLSADLVIRHLHADRQDYVRLDTDVLGTPACFFGFGSESELTVASRRMCASDVTAAWVRRVALPESLSLIAPEHADFVRRELATVMDGFLEAIPPNLQINPSYADRISGNRLLQAQKAKQAGFRVPEALVTQDAAEAREFLSRHPHAVTKAISFGRTSSSIEGESFAHTSEVPADPDLAGLEYCPSLFQENIPKRFDWRITSVGDRVFSARMEFETGDATDWRLEPRALTAFKAAAAPSDVTNRLKALATEGGIVYGAHDLIETATGEFVFIETNPAGQWGWLEITTGLPIGRAIADGLMRRVCLSG